MAGPGIARDDDVGTVVDNAGLGITPWLDDVHAEFLEHAAVGHDDAARIGVAVAAEGYSPLKGRKERRIGSGDRDGVDEATLL